ncbi:hypothetical protein Hanom_Chr11g01040781 [Helianthus anomalus]
MLSEVRIVKILGLALSASVGKGIGSSWWDFVFRLLLSPIRILFQVFFISDLGCVFDSCSDFFLSCCGQDLQVQMVNRCLILFPVADAGMTPVFVLLLTSLENYTLKRIASVEKKEFLYTCCMCDLAVEWLSMFESFLL